MKIIIDGYVEWLDGFRVFRFESFDCADYGLPVKVYNKRRRDPTAKRLRRSKQSIAQVLHRSAINREIWKCPEKRAAHSEVLKIARGTPEQRALTSMHNKQRYANEEERKKTQEATKRARSTPESRKKSSDGAKAQWANKTPEQLKAFSDAMKARWAKRRAEQAKE